MERLPFRSSGAEKGGFMAQIQTAVEPPGIQFDTMSNYQKEAMCRTLTSSINRLFEDERNRADFEQWKLKRTREK